MGSVFFTSRRRHTRCALVTVVQTCSLPISGCASQALRRIAPALPPRSQRWRSHSRTRVARGDRGISAAEKGGGLRLIAGARDRGPRPDVSLRMKNVLILGVLALAAGCGERDTSNVAAPDETSSAAREATSSNRSEEHTSELQSLMRISYAVFCLKKKKTTQ